MARRSKGLARPWRALVGAAAVAFGYLAYVYLTVPDVRALARENPETTAFIELRKREAAYDGRTKFVIRQSWVPYSRIAASLGPARWLSRTDALAMSLPSPVRKLLSEAG